MKYKYILKKMRKSIKDFKKKEDGVGVVEIILILVVLIGLVTVFRTQMSTIVKNIFETITSGVKGIK